MMFPSFSRRGRVLAWTVALLIWSLFVTPLIVTPGLLFPFQTGRGTAIRVLIELAAFFYGWLVLVERRARPGMHRVVWSVVAYAVVVAVSAATGVDPYRSFWGDLERMEGAFGTLHGAALVVIVAGLFTRREHWVVGFRLSLAVSMVVAWYALAQVAPWARWFPVSGVVTVQPGSTFGHSSFASTYVLFQVFIGGALMLLERTPLARRLAGSALLVNLGVLMLTAVRGSQVALLAAMAVGAIAIAADAGRKRSHRLAVVAGFVLCVGGFAAVRMLEGSALLDAAPHALKRMSTISWQTATAQTRLTALEISWKAVQERPWLGWGPEQFGAVYARFYDPEILAYEDVWFDRPHNKLAEVAVHSGLFGLLAYLAVLCASAAGLLRKMRQKANAGDRTLAIVVLMLGVAYVVQSLFLFDTAMSWTLLMLSIGFARWVAYDQARPDGGASDPRARRGSDPAPRTLIVASGAATAAVIFLAAVPPIQMAWMGNRALGANDPDEALSYFRQAVEVRPPVPDEVVRLMAHHQAHTGRSGMPAWESVNAAVCAEAERRTSEEPPDLRLLVQLGRLYDRRGPSFAADAERTFRRAIALAPRMPAARSELAVTLLRHGKIDPGLQELRTVVALNARNVRAHWVMGVAFLTQRRYAEAAGSIDTALALGYDWDTPEGIGVVTSTYAGTRDTARLRAFAGQVMARHPAEASYRDLLARAALMAGDTLVLRKQAPATSWR